MKAFILLVCALYTHVAWAQRYNDDYKLLTVYNLPKSPNATAFERFTSVPMGFQTGQSNFSIPLYTIETEGLTIPITLANSNTGLKVTDVASWVGVGWNLSVGGSITRSVRGIPDDGPMGLMQPYYADIQHRLAKGQCTGLERYHYYMDITKSLADSEHDMFSYSFLGMSGRFFINHLGEVVQLPRTNNVIQYTRNPNPLGGNTIDNFNITDENGNKFFFDLKEESTIFTLTNNVTGNTPNYFNRLKGSSWHLTKIQTRNGGQVLFEYSHYTYKKTEKTESHVCPTITPGPIGGVSGQFYTATYITTTVDVYQLSKVYWKNGYIEFVAGNARSDIQGIDATASVPFLSSVNIRQTSTPFAYFPSTIIKSVNFEYNQVNRLLLKKVTFSGLPVSNPVYQFNYYGEESNDWPSYNHLSSRYNAQDYWGYYNGQNSNLFLVPYSIIPNINNPLNPLYLGVNLEIQTNSFPVVNRVPNYVYAQTGMIKEIIYPSKGKSKFTYEPNTVVKSNVEVHIPNGEQVLNSLHHGTDAQNRTTVDLGGVRVKKVEFFEDANAVQPTSTTNIVYDQADVSTKFMPVFISAVVREYVPNLSETDPLPPCLKILDKLIYTIQSSPLVNNPAYLVEYHKVTEVSGSGDAGSTVHLYSPTFFGGNSMYWQAPLPEPAYMEWYSRETGSSVLTAQGNPVMESSTNKTANDPISIPLPDLPDYYGADVKIAVSRNEECNGIGTSMGDAPSTDAQADAIVQNNFTTHVTLLPTENFVVSQHTEKSYQPTGEVLEKTTTYNYSLTKPNRLLPESVTFTESKGTEVKTITSYPQDYLAGAPGNLGQEAMGIVNLNNKNLKDVPIEIIRTIKNNGVEYVVSGKLMLYFPNRTAVSEQYELQVADPIPLSNFNKSTINAQGTFVYDSRYERQKKFTQFDNRDQPLEVLDRKTNFNALIWDYEGTYITAEVTNSELSDVAFTSFETNSGGNWTIAGNTYQDLSRITGRRSYAMQSGSISKGFLVSGKEYIVSYWTSNATPYTINGTQGTPQKGKTVDGFTYFEHKVNNVNQIVIPQSTGLIDELRLYPSAARMTSYTYEPLIGVTSICSPNSTITYYSYDGLNRLQTISDQDHNVIKTMDYQYRQ